MKRVILLVTAVAALAVLAASAGATVTWTFYETGCTPINGSPGQQCLTLLPPDQAIGTLTLPGPTSSGSASWENGPTFTPPVLTGDTFSFVDALGFTIAPPSFVPNCQPPTLAPCFYNISWSEMAGQLESISISTQNSDYNIGVPFFGLTGGEVATDEPPIGNCPEPLTCEITGFWQSNLAVSEPMSATMLASGLAIFAAAGLALRHRAPH